MEGSGPLAFLFSRANRPWTLAIVVAVAALTAFLLLDGGGEAADAGGTTIPTETTALGTADAAGSETTVADQGTIAAVSGTLTADECFGAASALSLAASGGFGGAGTVDSVQMDEAFQRMSEVAPAEIADDLAIIATAFREFFSILDEEGVDLNDPTALSAPEAAAALERAGAALESSGMTQAADNVNAWFDSACSEFTTN